MLKKMVWLALIFILALADQISKTWVVSKFSYGLIYPIMPTFNIQLVYNYGISFSLFNMAIYYYLILGFGLMITMGLIMWLVKTPSDHKLKLSALSLILSGAIGNLVDRAFRGYVVDFIDFTIGNWHWYNFNLADICISLGAFLMMLDLFIHKEEGRLK